jgi:hypothetical protein
VDPFPIIAPRDPFPITTYYECMSIRFPLYANATNTYLSSVCKPITICTYILKIICTLITCSYIYSHNHMYTIIHRFSIICKQHMYYKHFLIPRIHHTYMSSTHNTPPTNHTYMPLRKVRKK